MVYSPKKNYFAPAIIILVLLLILILNFFIKPNLTVKTVCEVFPKEKWILTKGDNGQIISRVIDYTKGRTVQYNLNLFERGEQVFLKFSSDKNRLISSGDTVVSIISSDVRERVVEIEGDLEVAKASLKSQNTGEKESLINEAKARLNYTEEKISEQNVLLKKAETLYEKGLSSQQEFDTQKWIVDLLEIEKKIYKAQLQNLSTGAKSEEINLLKSQINSFDSRLKLLKTRQDGLTITAPISGYLSDVFSPDTLVSLINDREIILHAPIRIEDIELLKSGQIIRLRISDLEEEYKGLIISISREVKFINNQQVAFISIEIDNNNGKLLPGMIKESYLNIKEISFFEYISRFLST